mmetsp:Transcript_18056/g.20329  ORF Transcript_18056/g.20329 Transcript_18056/m.20329 type:complete len:240 (+) Transcript_18056:226-945(+)
MGVAFDVQELGSAVKPPQNQLAVPGPNRHIRDAVLFARDIAVFGQLTIQNIQLTLGFHGKSVDGIFELFRRIGIEMAKAAAQIGGAAHLPEQPAHDLGARCAFFGQEGSEFFGQMHQDRSGFKDTHRFVAAMIHQRRDLGVRVHINKPRPELIAITDIDQPSVILGVGVTGSQQFFQHHGDFDAIGCCQRIKLQRVLAHRQFLVMGGPGNWAVDRGKLPAVFLFPGPDFRGGIAGIAHL